MYMIAYRREMPVGTYLYMLIVCDLHIFMIKIKARTFVYKSTSNNDY